MNADTLTALPLDRAGLCLNCELVVELDAPCPKCARASVVSLARWVNRQDPVVPACEWIRRA